MRPSVPFTLAVTSGVVLAPSRTTNASAPGRIAVSPFARIETARGGERGVALIAGDFDGREIDQRTRCVGGTEALRSLDCKGASQQPGPPIVFAYGVGPHALVQKRAGGLGSCRQRHEERADGQAGGEQSVHG